MLSPKQFVSLFLMLLAVTFASVAFGADADDIGPAVNLTLLQGLVVAVIPVITSLVLQIIKKAVAFIPNEFLPILAPVVGVILQGLSIAFGFDLTPGIDGVGSLPAAAALGSTAVGLHQIKVQSVSSEPPPAATRKR